MTRYIYLKDGEDWLKQFERKRRRRLPRKVVFWIGFVLASAIAGGVYWWFYL